MNMRIFLFIFVARIFFAEGFIVRNLRMSTDITNVVKNRFLLQKEGYNGLVNKIENKDVSKIYFSGNLDSVIAENKEETGTIYEDYTITKINPLITSSLTDLSVKNKVETIFLVEPQPPITSVLANNVLGFIEGSFFPILFLSLLVANFRASQMSSNNPFSMPGMPGMPGSNVLEKDKLLVTKANITLSSFAGSPEIFEECTEVVSYLKNDTLYKNAGAEIPRGILLEGPPGTGKTLLAKAIASEADANFISVAASEFVELFVGMGAAKIRSLFKKARENAPCIIFIDEIDAVGKQRGTGINMGNDEREQTLNQLLAEMDGFADNEGILVMAATNRKDVLDAALLRPGRFDRLITVPFPDKESRKQILKVHSNNKVLESNINMDLVAELTNGFSGAQIKNLLNEAAILAAREGKTVITQSNILSSLDKLLVGIAKRVDTRDDDARRRVAIHETGHALLAALFDKYFELKKVTIQSTYNGAGGYTIFNECGNIVESGLYTKELLMKRLVVSLGGKAAENLFYGDMQVSVGAVQDLKQANSLAQRMIGNFGMGEKMEVFYNENVDNDRTPFLGRSLSMGDKYSDKTKQIFDKESINLVNMAYLEAKQLLEENRETMDKIVEELMQKVTLTGDEFKKLL
jgi:cell division protease FtsH